MASPKNALAERGVGGGVCRFWLVVRLIAAAVRLASSAAAAAAPLLARAALSEIKGGDAALNLEPILFVSPPPFTQPVLALGLSVRGWMLKPLSLELVCGPTGPQVLPITFSPWQLWAFLMGCIAHLT